MTLSKMETEMALAAGKNIKVTLKDGSVFQGYCGEFTQALDNEPEVAEIGIWRGSGSILGIQEHEIEKIEVLEGSAS